ncbi:RNA polymerase sigma factor [Nymphaea thermarum]|nr:RNA polymerase sigma factor [Nymphaea thermarum]
MATAAVVGLSTGKRLLSSSFFTLDLAEKIFPIHDHGATYFFASSQRNVIVSKKSSSFSSRFPSGQHIQSMKSLKEHSDMPSVHSTTETCFQSSDFFEQQTGLDVESTLEVLVLLQKSMLEKQWNLSLEQQRTTDALKRNSKEVEVTRSGLSARQRRTNLRMKLQNQAVCKMSASKRRQVGSNINRELLQSHVHGYVKGISNDGLLTHTEVVHLSEKIKAGMHLEKHRQRLKERLGFEPSDEQIASSLKISRAELNSQMIESSLARDKLTMSNVRLVMSIAQKYDNMGTEMADLIQGGLIGLLRGIEKFDSSKGFRISTYVYWWIRQMIAESLNMSEKKITNATEATNKIFSLDRDAFPSLNGLPGDTFHSYIADNNLTNNPWHGVEEWSLKEEVNRLISSTLVEREQDIVRLYYGLDRESHTWEDISKQIGLSRERVRQVGLVALEKLKLAARMQRLEAMLVKH